MVNIERKRENKKIKKFLQKGKKDIFQKKKE
jgi:hypothetical protein